MFIKRKELIQEIKLRKLVQKRIKKLLTEAATVADSTPHRYTGINDLEELLKNIIPTIEADYKKSGKITLDEFVGGATPLCCT